MNLRFDGRTAVVTGAATGIGYAIAEALAESGATVIVADIDLSGASEAAASLGNGALAVKVDVARHEEVEAMVAFAVEHTGRLDMLVNNAGIAGPMQPLSEYSIEDWHKVLDVNLHGVFYGMRYAVPVMRENGGGAIVNMASILGSVGFVDASAYVTSKHAVLGISKAAALEYAADGIRVNSVGPGFIGTELVKNSLDEATRAEMASAHALNRMGETAEVASLVVYLLSDQAGFITGSYHVVDGGYTAR
ncbi:MAG: SDR family NAD(P)-dependent oxidoreductase [Pseudomonadota bacterium]